MDEVTKDCGVCEGSYPENTMYGNGESYVCNGENAKRCFTAYVEKNFGKTPDEDELEAAVKLGQALTMMEVFE